MRGGAHYEVMRCGKAALVNSEGASDLTLTVDDMIGRPVVIDSSADLQRVISECRQLAKDFEGLAERLAG